MIWLGRGAAVFLGLALLGPVIAVGIAADWPPELTRFDWAAVRFTVVQAVLSTLASALFAVPLARALARRRFPGRDLAITLLGAPFLLPVIVAVFGIVAIWGRSGLLSLVTEPMGLGAPSIYGLTGILLAHVFFNVPLVARLLLFGWARIPGEHYRIAASLGLSPGARFRILELPMLREVLPGAMLLVFLLCMTSFAVVLTLGEGPRTTSVELAIFTAIRFEFDLARASVLALVQIVLCLGGAAVLLAMGRPAEMGPALGRDVGVGQPGLWQDRIVLAAAFVFFALPLVAVVWRGIGPVLNPPPEVWPALLWSLTIAGWATVLAIGLALAMAPLILGTRGWVADGLALLPLVVSPFVLGTGLFLLINPVASPFDLAIPVTVMVNALLALPFAVRLILPALARVDRDYGRLSASLGLSPMRRARLVLWPALKRPLGFAAGLTAALAMGDLGVIALFAPTDAATLPLLVHRLTGAYRMEDAAGVALLLVGASFAVFAVFERGGRIGASL